MKAFQVIQESLSSHLSSAVINAHIGRDEHLSRPMRHAYHGRYETLYNVSMDNMKEVLFQYGSQFRAYEDINLYDAGYQHDQLYNLTSSLSNNSF